MEEKIKIAAKLYEVRSTAKRLYREEYQEKLAPFMKIIKGIADKYDISELNALLKISKNNDLIISPQEQLMLIAATVELIEPSHE